MFGDVERGMHNVPGQVVIRAQRFCGASLP